LRGKTESFVNGSFGDCRSRVKKKQKVLAIAK
jgi:hypothetical protein